MKKKNNQLTTWTGWSLGILGALLLSGCGGDGPPDNPYNGLNADAAFVDGPFYLSGAFDGSKRFGMWVDTLDFARRIEREYDKGLRWTYFINTCYFDRDVRGSWIGTAKSRDEEIVRWALVQQAINEGHEIGNHAVRHQDGTNWTEEQWREEIREFHALFEANLFEPLHDLGYEPVFPVWQPLAEAEPGMVGALCDSNDECDHGICLPVAPARSFCSKPCNSNRPCPEGTVCGAPDWNTSTDVCVPMPAFPVEYEGEVLFDEYGNPNPDSLHLVSYRPVGFRAPQLGYNQHLYEVLTEFGYFYDTSQVLRPGPPRRTSTRGITFDKLYQFGLMKNPGSATIPMDYNYLYNDVSGERMLRDYKQSILDFYGERDRQPWNIGHHFSLWKGGAYWRAMQGAFEFAAQGCPDAEGESRCPETRFVTFKDLTYALQSLNESNADALGKDVDLFEFDYADDLPVEGRQQDCHCEEDQE